MQSLVDKGKLGLVSRCRSISPSSPIRRCWCRLIHGEDRAAKRVITIRHLLTHSSGLGYTSTEKVGPIYTPALHTISSGAVQARRESHIAGRAPEARPRLLFDLGLGDRRFSAASAARPTCSRARVPTGSAARRGLPRAVECNAFGVLGGSTDNTSCYSRACAQIM